MTLTPPSTCVETAAQLRGLYREPSVLSQQKCLTQLDQHCTALVGLSPFVCIATTAADGSLDISPRGDPPGSIQVLDNSTLLIPDRSGNNRLDTLTNLTGNPQIALIFFVPGVIETLRVTGRGQVIHGDPRLEACVINGKVPPTGILVTITRTFLQCGKAVKRAALWEDTHRVERTALASFGTMRADQTGSGQSPAELDAAIAEAYEKRLY